MRFQLQGRRGRRAWLGLTAYPDGTWMLTVDRPATTTAVVLREPDLQHLRDACDEALLQKEAK